MTDDVLAELDRTLGPVALMSLQNRGLLPAGRANPRAAETLPDRAVLLDRVTGALIGAAVGNALGRLSEKRQRRLGLPQHLPVDWVVRRRLAGPSAKVRSGAQQLELSVRALLDAGTGAPGVLSDRLVASVRELRVPGRATVATVEARRAGTPWFEAGTGSFGEGALCRAVAAGVFFADDPVRRPLLAGIDAAVTHASQRAVDAATLVAEVVAAAVRGEVVVSTASPQLDTVALDQEAESTAAAALHLVAAFPGDPVTAIATAASVPGSPDTFAALTGALAGAAAGASALPDRWADRVELRSEMCVLASRIVGHLLHDPEATGSHIWFLLDRSGSMESIAESVVAGFNSFFAQQRAAAGTAQLTFVQFDDADRHEVLLDAVDISTVKPMRPGDFAPRGSTPLLDAIALLLDRAERRGGEPTDNLVVVFTDGHENASREWDRARLFRRISTLRDSGYTFVFLGANQDSYAEGGSIGFDAGNTSNFRASAPSVAAAYAGLGRATTEWRGKGRQARRVDQAQFWAGRKEAEELDKGNR